MAIDFPSAPADNQEVTLAGVTYIWNGQIWTVKPGGGGGGGLPSGTVLMFLQPTAPVGWTQAPAGFENRALRLTDTLATGGTVAGTIDFNTLFARTATDGFSLTEALMATHGHQGYQWQGPGNVNASGYPAGQSQGATPGNNFSTTQSGGNPYANIVAGGAGPHSHGLDMQLKYVNAIVCVKD